MDARPCSSCRRVHDAYFKVCAGQKKLGSQERRLLLISATSDGIPVPAFPQYGTAASQVAMRRAIAGLCRIGLLEVVDSGERVSQPPAFLRRLDRKAVRPRSICQTPFGLTLQ